MTDQISYLQEGGQWYELNHSTKKARKVTAQEAAEPRTFLPDAPKVDMSKDDWGPTKFDTPPSQMRTVDLTKSLANIPESAWDFIKGAAGSTADLVRNFVPAPGSMGISPMALNASKDPNYLSKLGMGLAEPYLSADNFQQAIEKDPVRVAGDISTLAGPFLKAPKTLPLREQLTNFYLRKFNPNEEVAIRGLNAPPTTRGEVLSEMASKGAPVTVGQMTGDVGTLAAQSRAKNYGETFTRAVNSFHQMVDDLAQKGGLKPGEIFKNESRVAGDIVNKAREAHNKAVSAMDQFGKANGITEDVLKIASDDSPAGRMRFAALKHSNPELEGNLNSYLQMRQAIDDNLNNPLANKVLGSKQWIGKTVKARGVPENDIDFTSVISDAAKNGQTLRQIRDITGLKDVDIHNLLLKGAVDAGGLGKEGFDLKAFTNYLTDRADLFNELSPGSAGSRSRAALQTLIHAGRETAKLLKPESQILKFTREAGQTNMDILTYGAAAGTGSGMAKIAATRAGGKVLMRISQQFLGPALLNPDITFTLARLKGMPPGSPAFRSNAIKLAQALGAANIPFKMNVGGKMVDVDPSEAEALPQ